MPAFGASSRKRLATCDDRLVRLANIVIQQVDCTIPPDGGARTYAEHMAFYRAGKSRTLNSKHIVSDAHPKSRAIHLVPYPVRWPNLESTTYEKDLARFYYLGGRVLGIASQLGLKVRWGGDWDLDGEILDQDFDDLAHYELVE